MIVNIDDATYLGSCSNDKYGIGNLIRGKSYRKTDDGFEMECLDGEWIPVYCIVKLIPGSNQSSSTQVQWM